MPPRSTQRGSDSQVCINAAVPLQLRPPPPPPLPPRALGGWVGGGTLYGCVSQHHPCATLQVSGGEQMFEPSPTRGRKQHTHKHDGQRRDSMVSGMAQRRGPCDITSGASLPPDGARGVSFGATAVMEVDTLHGAPDPGSAHNMGNILPKSQGRTKGPVASHAPHRAPMTEGLLLPVEEAPTEWCAGGSPRSGGVLQRLWNENASVLIGLSLMKECRVQLPTRAAPKGDVTMVKHHVSIMLPRLAFVAAHTTHSLLFAWAWDPNLLPGAAGMRRGNA